MEGLIKDILIRIELDKRYIELCNAHNSFEDRFNIKRRDIEGAITEKGLNFKYESKDNTFLKEEFYEAYSVRYFIGFKGGIIDFSYLIWKEGENEKFYKGRFASLVEMIEPDFKKLVKYQTPIATTVQEAEIILNEMFSMFNLFHSTLGQEILERNIL